MFFQKVLKGIAGVSRQYADTTFEGGIICNWWRRVGNISPAQIVEKLTDRNLDWHLNHYNDPDPIMGNTPFCENSPFISVTAGVVEREAFLQQNIVYDPFITAMRFATLDFTTKGFIFYAYVFTLGRQSINLAEFAEEVRELNIYKNYLPFHPEGEIATKIEIRGPQIERWEEYDGPARWRCGQFKGVPCPSQDSFEVIPPTHHRNSTATSADW
jgi:hypothetical protein